MIKRPAPGEAEEDLLKLQEDFLKSKVNPSVTVIKAGDKRKAEGGRLHESAQQKPVKVKRDVVKMAGLPALNTDEPFKKQSRIKKKRSPQPGTKSQRIVIDLEEDEDPFETMEAKDSDLHSVLTKIMERDVKNVPVYLPHCTREGFPTVLHRGQTTENSGKKKSLFAQQVESSKSSIFGLSRGFPPVTVASFPYQSTTTDQEPTNRKESQNATIRESSSNITPCEEDLGPKESNQQTIHQENVNKLKTMSHDEILKEQRRLLSILDPAMVEFLKLKNTPSQNSRTADIKVNPVDITTNDKPFLKDIASPKSDGEEAMESQDDAEETKTLEIEKEWVNMAEVETEKLEWMKELPKPKAKSKDGHLARFDFNGRLLARDANVPVREGLHHHGDEQEVPGYTVEELFILSRSTLQSQRVIGLQTLARIIYSYRIDDIGGDLKKPLILMLLRSGFMFLLRWALDDSSEVVIGAAMEALASFLINPGDEETLDKIFFWSHGYEVPRMLPVRVQDEDEEMVTKDKSSKPEELTDTEIVEKDAVQGLLKMKLLPRIRYILEIVRPTAPVVLNALTVLTRLARHSPGAANEIAKCPRMMDTIIPLFMPTSTWKNQGDLVTNVYNYPVITAVKLVRVLCQTGRNMASTLLSKYYIMSVVIRYVTIEPTDMHMNIGEAFHLSIESLRLWQILIGYGLSCDVFRELYPLFMQHLQHFQRLSVLPLSVTEEQATVAVHRLQLQRACAIFGVLEGVVNVAGTAAHLQAQLSIRSNGESSPNQVPPPPIDWSHVTGLLGPVELCFQKWTAEMTRAELTLEMEAMNLAGSCFNFITSFYEQLSKQPSYNAIDCLQHIEVLTSRSLVPFMTSSAFYSMILNLRNHSSCNYKPDKTRSCPSLPDFGCHVAIDLQLHPCVQRASTYGIVGHFLNLVTTFVRIHKGIAVKFCTITDSSYVIGYLESVVSKLSSSSNNPSYWFSRFEHHVLFSLLTLYYLVAQQADSCHQHSNLYHSTALVLFTSLFAGDEHLAHALLSTMLFHTNFLVEGTLGDAIAADLADFLTTSDTIRQPALSKTIGMQESLQRSRGELLQEAYTNLAGIRSMYMVFFAWLEKDVIISRARANHIAHEVQSFVLPAHSGQLAPSDWMFMPLLHLYSEAQTAEMMGKSVQCLAPHITSTVVNSLRWIFMLETWRPDSLKVVPLAAKMTRLFCLFLTGNDLFFEDQVRTYLTQLMRMYTTPSWHQELNFNVPIPGVASFPDLYISLLNQYSAVSFGDHLFGHAILLPLQQRFSVQLRRAVWSEHAGVIRSLSIPIKKFILPLEGFLNPPESNQELLSMYLSGLLDGTIKQPWCRVLYLVAIHHLSNYLFVDVSGQDNKELVKKKIRTRIINIKDQMIRKQILYYKCVNKSSSLGFDLFDELPLSRSQHLQRISSASSP